MISSYIQEMKLFKNKELELELMPPEPPIQFNSTSIYLAPTMYCARFWECRVTKSEILQSLEETDVNKSHDSVKSTTADAEGIRMGVYEWGFEG